MLFVCPDALPAHRTLLFDAASGAFSEAGHELRVFDGAPSTIDEWNERLVGADGLLFGWPVPAGVLSATPSLKVGTFLGTGAARFVDLDEAGAAGVAICNVPSYGANAIAEHAIALMFAVARRIAELDRAVRAAEFPQWEMVELRGLRLGIVGLGEIGVRTAELGLALGMEVSAWTRRDNEARCAALGVSPATDLRELFAGSDVISLHLSHVPETEGLIDAELIGALPDQAIFINTARGELVDNQALADALDSGLLRGVGADVYREEPPAATEPLLTQPRAVLTSHVAYNTPAAVRDLYRRGIENLTAFAAGEPTNVVGGEH
ncbi:MAG TPA: NAD(P)-dependent oxidoreductase [Solirubrobacterales bacterium]